MHCLRPPTRNSNSAFTLIEILVTVGILAILATVTVFIINPTQFSAQARDSQRVSDLQTINTAMKFAVVQGLSEGTANTVYVSIPDTSATCDNLGLPDLSAGLTYACATAENHRKVDGTGWVPVAFDQLSTGAPLSVLPVDPINTVESGNYYLYIPGGSWELIAVFESTKYSEYSSTDGGLSTSHYEIGTDLALAEFLGGLIAYWPMDEGSGTTTADQSGNGHTGTLTNGPTWAAGVSGNSVSFGGTGSYDHLVLANSSDFSTANFTVVGWVYPSNVSGGTNVIFSNSRSAGSYTANGIHFYVGGNTLRGIIWNGSTYNQIVSASTVANNSGWHQFAFTYDGTNMKLYYDGNLDKTQASSLGVGLPATYSAYVSRSGYSITENIYGRLDELRVYSRALSDSEILALYQEIP